MNETGIMTPTTESAIPSREDIARRAYELYEQRGCLPGHELEDWLAAEAELSATQPTEISQESKTAEFEIPTSTPSLKEDTSKGSASWQRAPHAATRTARRSR